MSLRNIAAVTLSTVLLLSTGCSETLQKLKAVAAAAEDNKALIEQFAQDVQAHLAPETESYQQSRALYADAAAANKAYVAQAVVDVLTGTDETGALADKAFVAHTAATRFVQTATRSLSPNTDDRSIPFGLVVHQLPGVLHTLITGIPAGERPKLALELAKVSTWRGWDDIGAEPDNSHKRQHRSKNGKTSDNQF